MDAWFVDVGVWDPASPEWQQALRLLPEEEQQQVTRFMFVKDKRLALASRLLQRQLIRHMHHISWTDIHIQRTPEGKSYWVRSNWTNASSMWNFNVSHHGTVVAIAAHDKFLVGVDVMDLRERPKPRNGVAVRSEEFFRAFAEYFTLREWQYITQSGDDDSRFHRFYRLWSLKEAYIKAIGIGLGFQLLRAEFCTVNQDDESLWQMKLDGELASQWKFRSDIVVGTHIVSTALGPMSDMHSPATSSIVPSADLTALAPAEFPVIEWHEKTLAQLTPR